MAEWATLSFMMQWCKGLSWQECQRIGRFIIIGGISFGLYAGTYAVFSRMIWVDGNRTLQIFFAGAISSLFNFFSHRHWTFRVQSHIRQWFRYGLVLTTAILLQSGLFWVGHVYLRWYDLIALVLVGGFVACYTYLLHRFFTFRSP